MASGSASPCYELSLGCGVQGVQMGSQELLPGATGQLPDPAAAPL